MIRLFLALAVAALGTTPEPAAASAAPTVTATTRTPVVVSGTPNSAVVFDTRGLAGIPEARRPAALPATRTSVARPVAGSAAGRATTARPVGGAPAGRPVGAAPGSLTWTVQPATAAGPDGRRWIERTLDPGQEVTEYLAVRNFSEVGGTFALKAADGYLTENGRFNMLPSGSPSEDGGTWITVPEKITVAAKATALVPFTITVPPGATPGDHPAGIAATVLSRSGTVQVESRVGFRVLLRASGMVRKELSAGSVDVRYERSWNPLRAGRVEVSYTATNSGNVRVDGQAQVKVSSLLGSTNTASGLGQLLPGGDRTARADVTGVWGFGRLRTTLTLTPGDAAGATTLTTTTWVMPWPQLLLLAAAFLLFLMFRWANRRRGARLRQLLEQARLEGRRSATEEG